MTAPTAEWCETRLRILNERIRTQSDRLRKKGIWKKEIEEIRASIHSLEMQRDALFPELDLARQRRAHLLRKQQAQLDALTSEHERVQQYAAKNPLWGAF